MNALFPIFWITLLVLTVLRRGAAAGSKKSSGSAGSAPQPAARKPVSRRRARQDDDCDYGEANHKYSHESEGRIRQLDSYLKAGLIDKKEYAQMLDRYQRAERDFERYE